MRCIDVPSGATRPGIDAAHKLTTDLTRRFEAIVIEDLNVIGMAKNHSLTGAVLDCGCGEICRHLSTRQQCAAAAS